MRYIKIRFLDWRKAAQTNDQLDALAQLDDLRAQSQAAEQQAAAIDVAADEQAGRPLTLEEVALRDKLLASAEELSTKMLEQETRYKAGTDALRDRERIGSLGYQEIDKNGNLVRLLDETGVVVPDDVVVGYQVINAAAPMPAWGIPDVAP